MKKYPLLVLLCFGLCSATALARDSINDYSIADTLSLAQSKSKLGSQIKFYFGDQAHAKIAQNYGDVATNKKTNAFNKSDKEACQWVFLSAMLELKKRAQREGGNAVVNIKSNYKDNLTSSAETFQCGAGTFLAGVALTGKVVKLAK